MRELLKQIGSIKKTTVSPTVAKNMLEEFDLTIKGATWLTRLLIPISTFVNNVKEIKASTVKFAVVDNNWGGYLGEFYDYINNTDIIKNEILNYIEEYGSNVEATLHLTDISTKSAAMISVTLIAFPIKADQLLDNRKIVLDSFEFNKSEVPRFHETQLETLAKYTHKSWENQQVQTFRPIIGFVIVGHTDLVGNEESNLVLGQQRANSVKKQLKDSLRHYRYNFSLKYITPLPRSSGELHPVEPEEGKNPKNRRVEITPLRVKENITVPLNKIKKSIEERLKHDTKIAPWFKKEVMCITSRITDFSYEDEYMHKLTVGEKFSPRSLQNLRYKLIILYYYTSLTDDKRYSKFIKIIAELRKDAYAFFARYPGGEWGGPTLRPEDKKRYAFLRQRICKKNPDSIYGCFTKGERFREFSC